MGMTVTCDRQILLDALLKKGMGAKEIAGVAGVNYATVRNALIGKPLFIKTATKIFRALDIEPRANLQFGGAKTLKGDSGD